MVIKKKSFGFLKFFLSVLLVLVFGMGLSTCSYAYVTSDFIQFCLDKVSSGEIYSSSDVSSFNATNIANNLNTIINNNNVNNDNLVVCFPESITDNLFNVNCKMVVFVSNNTFGVDSLPFVIFSKNNTKKIKYRSYNNETISIYHTNNGDTFSKITLSSSNLNSSNYDITFSSSSYNNLVNTFNPYTFNSNLSVVDTNCFLTTKKTASNYFKYSTTNTYTGTIYPALINYPGLDFNSWLNPSEPENPEEPGQGGTGTITNPSGDTTGKVDLSGIEQGIGQINQNLENTNEKLDGISGEIGKLNENLTTVPDFSDTSINSGDITDALGFEFAEDPYSNFWFELTTGLGDALTGSERSIDIEFRGQHYTINLDNFTLQLPIFLKSFLTILSTVFIFWKMIKYWKIILDKITSGGIDEVLEMNEEERHI